LYIIYTLIKLFQKNQILELINTYYPILISSAF
jgi:hypothetical protein